MEEHDIDISEDEYFDRLGVDVDEPVTNEVIGQAIDSIENGLGELAGGVGMSIDEIRRMVDEREINRETFHREYTNYFEVDHEERIRAQRHPQEEYIQWSNGDTERRPQRHHLRRTRWERSPQFERYKFQTRAMAHDRAKRTRERILEGLSHEIEGVMYEFLDNYPDVGRGRDITDIIEALIDNYLESLELTFLMRHRISVSMRHESFTPHVHYLIEFPDMRPIEGSFPVDMMKIRYGY